MLKKKLWILALCCCVQACFAQSAVPVQSKDSKAAAVPITTEPSHHLVLENEYVRVFKVEVPPHGETQFHQHDLDYVFVTLGDSDVESVRVGEQPVRLQLKDGETRFTKGGFAHKAVNLSDKPFVNVTVELKKNDKIVPPHGEGGGCFGLVCDFAIFTTQHARCRQITTAGSGTGFGLPTEAKRLVIAITNAYEGSPKKLLHAGDVWWSASRLEFDKSDVPPKVVVCEFAASGEDFLKRTPLGRGRLCQIINEEVSRRWRSMYRIRPPRALTRGASHFRAAGAECPQSLFYQRDRLAEC